MSSQRRQKNSYINNHHSGSGNGEATDLKSRLPLHYTNDEVMTEQRTVGERQAHINESDIGHEVVLEDLGETDCDGGVDSNEIHSQENRTAYNEYYEDSFIGTTDESYEWYEENGSYSGHDDDDDEERIGVKSSPPPSVHASLDGEVDEDLRNSFVLTAAMLSRRGNRRRLGSDPGHVETEGEKVGYNSADDWRTHHAHAEANGSNNSIPSSPAGHPSLAYPSLLSRGRDQFASGLPQLQTGSPMGGPHRRHRRRPSEPENIPSSTLPPSSQRRRHPHSFMPQRRHRQSQLLFIFRLWRSFGTYGSLLLLFMILSYAILIQLRLNAFSRNHYWQIHSPPETPSRGISDVIDPSLEWHIGARKLAKTTITARKQDRAASARPPQPPQPALGAMKTHQTSPHHDIEAFERNLSWYSFSALEISHFDGKTIFRRPEAPPLDLEDKEKNDEAHDWETNLLSPADAQELCGSHAKDASLADPQSFVRKDALNSKARVLITGIASSQIGFHLALALSQQCSVGLIMGVDMMYPNGAINRLDLLDRINTLGKLIRPRLAQPILLPFIGLDPKLIPGKKTSIPRQVLAGTGELNLLTFRPTHVIHLAADHPSSFMDYNHQQKGNIDSPYSTTERQTPMHSIRQGLTSMEQLLSSVSSAPVTSGGFSAAPHLTYVSSNRAKLSQITNYSGNDETESTLGNDVDHVRWFHGAGRLIDEVLSATYNSLYEGGVHSVGLRLPEVYGPWGPRGSATHDLCDAALKRRLQDGKQFVTKNDIGNDSKQELLFVDDAVSAIIAAMQYRNKQKSTVFEISSGEEMSMSNFASVLNQHLSGKSDPDAMLDVPSIVLDATNSKAKLATKSALHWSPKTELKDGVPKLLSWHITKNFPNGPPPNRNGLLKWSSNMENAVGLLSTRCNSENEECFQGRKLLPCASECVPADTPSICKPSIFDDIAAVSRELTDGCDIVLYTSSLGYDVSDILLETTPSEEIEGESVVCNLAFVPKDSELVVKKALPVVPSTVMTQYGLSSKSTLEEKLEVMNGRLLYKGWILVWVPDATEKIPSEELNLPKLSPAKLFASSVRHAMFVDQFFSVTPNVDDVRFLTKQMHRPALPRRMTFRRDKDGKKQKFVLPAEPEKRAAMLLSTLKQKKTDDKNEPRPSTGKKLGAYEAAKYMTFEVGGDPNASEPKMQKQQREFYERIPSFVNRDDMRSTLEPLHRYELRHWARTRWVLNDLKLEEGRSLRCDWYREHTTWQNELDQLSFAHVMAKRELERKFALNEIDDRLKASLPKTPEMEFMTDGHEWHLLLGAEPQTKDSSSNVLPETLQKLPDHLFDPEEEEEKPDAHISPEMHKKDDEEEEEEEKPGHGNSAPASNNEPGVYVRIMSDRVMLLARKAWSEYRRNKPKKKRKSKKKKNPTKLHKNDPKP